MDQDLEIRHRLLGLLMILAAVTIIPVGDAIAKYLGQSMSTAQVVWGRYFFHFLIFVPFILYRIPLRELWPKGWCLQICRALILLAATFAFFFSLNFIPLVEATALVFVSPFAVVLFSIPILGERLGFRRILAVCIGFIAVLIILRPGYDSFHWGGLFAIIAAIGFAMYVVLTRLIAGRTHFWVTMFYLGTVGMIVSSIFVIPYWQMPSAEQWILMSCNGLVAGSGHLFLIKATEVMEATFIAPFQYFEIVMATILGYVLFGEFPDQVTWVGVVIVIGAGVFLAHRDRRTFSNT